MEKETSDIGDFEIARGGPFYELQRRIGLLHEDAFRAAPRALLFVVLAWGAPFLLSLIEGHAFGKFDDHPYLLALVSWSLLPISAMALLPLVAAGATQLPFKEIISVFKKLLLL